jgi:hypothetical protein
LGQSSLSKDEERFAERVRKACIEAAIEGYEHAGMSGLCQEGAWEAAISAIQMIDVKALGSEEDGQQDDK